MLHGGMLHGGMLHSGMLHDNIPNSVIQLTSMTLNPHTTWFWAVVPGVEQD
jgi:hypothetical protein